ncbi:MAG: type IV toxin-antitoxin system AbiEi family antitoxin [Burkholderiales bacterium]
MERLGQAHRRAARQVSRPAKRGLTRAAARTQSPRLVGRYRVEFQPMPPNAFTRTNRTEWLAGMKTSAEAKVAGIELALLDCAKWFHKAGGISQVAQIARQLGDKASPRRLAAIARACDNADVMRLGYLLELAGHEQQAKALDAFTQDARQKLLDPTSKIDTGELSGRWKITLNTPPE